MAEVYVWRRQTMLCVDTEAYGLMPSWKTTRRKTARPDDVTSYWHTSCLPLTNRINVLLFSRILFVPHPCHCIILNFLRTPSKLSTQRNRQYYRVLKVDQRKKYICFVLSLHLPTQLICTYMQILILVQGPNDEVTDSCASGLGLIHANTPFCGIE